MKKFKYFAGLFTILIIYHMQPQLQYLSMICKVHGSFPNSIVNSAEQTFSKLELVFKTNF